MDSPRARAYLRQVGVPDILNNMIQAILEKQPDDAVSFYKNYFDKLYATSHPVGKKTAKKATTYTHQPKRAPKAARPQKRGPNKRILTTGTVSTQGVDVDRLIEQVKSSGQPFVDDAFPPNSTSLGQKSGSGNGAVVSGPGGPVSWARPNRFMDVPHLFTGNEDGTGAAISPADVMQGSLGDCWFLSALSVLAEDPKRITSLFRTGDEELANGLVSIYMVADGCPQEVVIDSFIPIYSDYNQPCYAKNKGSEMWAMLLEKAYAKVNKNYAGLNGGDPGEALADLTGAPYFRIKAMGTKDPDAFWKQLLEVEKEGFVLTATIGQIDGIDTQQSFGLPEGHAYGVLDVRQIPEGRLLQIRNPWGSCEWKGKWGDAWDGWTDELKHKLGYEDKDNGVFWMDLTDFVKFYESVQVLALRPGWLFEHAEGVLQEEMKHDTFEFSIDKSTSIALTVHQARGSPIALRFCVLNKDTGAPVGGSSEVFQETTTLCCRKIDLDPGEYLVMVEPYTGSTMPAKIAISTYSPKSVTITENQDLIGKYGFLLPEFAKENGVCARCDIALGGRIITAMGEKWHPKCWQCHQCHCELTGSYSIMKGHPLCLKCAASDEPKCQGCHLGITGQYITALGGSWHPDCFKCFRCSTKLNGPFAAIQNKPYCQKCARLMEDGD